MAVDGWDKNKDQGKSVSEGREAKVGSRVASLATDGTSSRLFCPLYPEVY